MMKKHWITALATFGVIGALAGCSPAKPAPEAEQTQAGQTQQVATTQTVQGPAVDPNILIGRWGDNGDCNADIVFARDGRCQSYTGGEGRWSLIGDTLMMLGDNGAFELKLRVIDSDHIQTISEDGSVNMSQRC